MKPHKIVPILEKDRKYHLEPDPKWVFTDSSGHIHYWVGNKVPTIHEVEVYEEDDSDYMYMELQCIACGEHIVPGEIIVYDEPPEVVSFITISDDVDIQNRIFAIMNSHPDMIWDSYILFNELECIMSFDEFQRILMDMNDKGLLFDNIYSNRLTVSLKEYGNNYKDVST